MARRTRGDAPPAVVTDERAAVWRFRALGGVLAACDPPDPVRPQIVAARDRIAAAGMAPADALAAFEDALAELGLADVAERHVAHLLAARQRWAPADDFANATRRTNR